VEDFNFLQFSFFILITLVIVVSTFRILMFLLVVLPAIGDIKVYIAISCILTVWILWSVCQIPGVTAWYVDFFRYMPGTVHRAHNPMLDRS